MGIHTQTVIDLEHHRLSIKEGNILTDGNFDGIEIYKGLQPVIILYTTEMGELVARVRDADGFISQICIAR
jgi:hypothetical protein